MAGRELTAISLVKATGNALKFATVAVTAPLEFSHPVTEVILDAVVVAQNLFSLSEIKDQRLPVYSPANAAAYLKEIGNGP